MLEKFFKNSFFVNFFFVPFLFMSEKNSGGAILSFGPIKFLLEERRPKGKKKKKEVVDRSHIKEKREKTDQLSTSFLIFFYAFGLTSLLL